MPWEPLLVSSRGASILVVEEGFAYIPGGDVSHLEACALGWGSRWRFWPNRVCSGGCFEGISAWPRENGAWCK